MEVFIATKKVRQETSKQNEFGSIYNMRIEVNSHLLIKKEVIIQVIYPQLNKIIIK